MTSSMAPGTAARAEGEGPGALQDAVTIVTGGGSGLGAAICEELAAAGADVVCVDVDADGASGTAQRISAAGGRCRDAVVDLRDEQSIDALVGAVLERHGRVDVLVNNAGTDECLPVDELSVADWDRVLGVNLRAPFVLARAVLPGMKERRSGSIVNIASTAAKRQWANASAYHASKAGVLAFSNALHVEAREHGVRVTAIVAGGMRTPFILDRFPDVPLDVLQEPRNVAKAARFALTQPDGTVIPELIVTPLRETSYP